MVHQIKKVGCLCLSMKSEKKLKLLMIEIHEDEEVIENGMETREAIAYTLRKRSRNNNHNNNL